MKYRIYYTNNEFNLETGICLAPFSEKNECDCEVTQFGNDLCGYDIATLKVKAVNHYFHKSLQISKMSDEEFIKEFYRINPWKPSSSQT